MNPNDAHVVPNKMLNSITAFHNRICKDREKCIKNGELIELIEKENKFFVHVSIALIDTRKNLI